MTNNYDPQEIEKFAALAHNWWDPASDLKMLHELNPLRLNYIKEKFDLSQKLVLDVGCGGGILAESLAREGAKVTGIDLNKAVLDVANLHQIESGTTVNYILTSAESLALERPNYYDAVICLEMLEHVPDPASIVRSCASLLKPEGKLFFSTINRHPKAYLFAIIGAEYLLKLLPKNTHDYAKFIRPAELCAWARQVGILPMELKGMTYDPFNKKFKLTNDLNVNYLFYGIKT